jgi:membrane protease YdiL (CAAX protease family)
MDTRKTNISALIEGITLLLAMLALLFTDPLSINQKIIDYLRFKYPIFVQEPRLLTHTYVYVGGLIAKLLAMGLITAVLLARREGLAESLALKAPPTREWIKYIAPFVILSLGVRLYYALDPLLPNLPIRLIMGSATFIGNVIFVISVIIVAPVIEELIFRGYFFGVFKRNFGASFSIVITAALFSLAHVTQSSFSTLNIAVIFAFGALFGLLREKTDSIIVPMIFHGIYNLAYVGVGIFSFLILGY